MILPDPPILIITDRQQCAEPLEARAESLFRGGCRWLSLREKDLDPEDRSALLQRLTRIGALFGATIGVHDDIEAAQKTSAALHLPAQADAPLARRALGSGTLIGQSCHREDELIAARNRGADYATLSPFFVSASKPDYRPVFDQAELAAMIGRVGLPVLALGGVTLATLSDLANSGVQGIAVMGEAMRAPQPEAWFARIAALWQSLTTGFRTASPASHKA